MVDYVHLLAALKLAAVALQAVVQIRRCNTFLTSQRSFTALACQLNEKQIALQGDNQNQ